MKKRLQDAVLPYTLRGKVWVKILQSLYAILALFKKRQWTKPLEAFEENPINMSKKWEHLLYFGYKYYYRPPVAYPTAQQVHFQEQSFNFTPNQSFIAEKTITISAGGDLMPYTWIQQPYTEYLWEEVGDFFFSADIVLANLETPIVPHKSPHYVPEVMLNDMHFNGSEEMFSIFSGNGKYKGYDLLATANNHSWDMGEEGVIETIRFLEKKGVQHVGTARDREERYKIPLLERNGIKVAFINYTYSLNKFTLPPRKAFMVNHLRLNSPEVEVESIKKDVLNAKNRGADLVILITHAGNAYQPYPSWHTVEIYHHIFDTCGVDVILGTHPHNPQPMEKYTFTCPFEKVTKQGFVIYSLGDFIAYDIFIWGRLIPLLKMTVQQGLLNQRKHTQLTKVEVLPVYNWGQKDLSKGKELRLLDFYQLLDSIARNDPPAFLSPLCLREVATLQYFWENYFLSNSQKEAYAVSNRA